MKKLALFFFILMAITSIGSAYAQNGNVVVSMVDIEDQGNGTALIVVKLSGNQASNYPGGTFAISGERVANGAAEGTIGEGGRVVVTPPVPGNGNSNGNEQVILAAIFPLARTVGNQSDQVEVTFHFYPRLGNGLDYTYSRVGRIKRPRTGI